MTMEWPDSAVAEFTTSYQQDLRPFPRRGPKGWIDFQEHALVTRSAPSKPTAAG